MQPILTFLLLFTSAKASEVIVIGAGASGIAAATKLLQYGFKVTVLEAEGRIGGRIQSLHFGQAYVDLGAAWVHGEDGNLVYEMVKDLEMLSSTNVDFNITESDGFGLEKELQSELNETFWKISAIAGQQEEGVALVDFFEKAYLEEIQERFGDNPEDLATATFACDMFKHYLLSVQPSELKVSAKSDMVALPGDPNLNWKGKGYKTILEILLERQTKFNPILDTEVVKIKWNRDEVDVSCKDGRVFTAKHVIFTPGLGVLKAQHTHIFEPPLGEDKIKAIQSLGFGVVFRVLLEFESRWWDGLFPVSYLWKDRKSKITDLTWSIEMDNNPNVLMLWFTGANIPDLEKYPDEIFSDMLMEALDQYFGTTRNISQPIKMIRSSWATNPYFGGCYTYETARSREQVPSSHIILSEPLVHGDVPKVLFAGEATHPIYYASVHGAIETGYREAERLISFYKN